MDVGLRVDVDTYNGTRDGVPSLLATFSRHEIRATFFFSVGSDNMGRHIWRLLRPSFLTKILRSNAGSLYGWNILLRGTFWPGPKISRVLSEPLRQAERSGHEIGLHARDHHRWQKRAGRLTVEEIAGELQKGSKIIEDCTGRGPECFAAPGWRGTVNLLRVEEDRGLRYGSDCRGRSIFLPIVNDRTIAVPQVPVTLPTYDEIIGRHDLTDRTYNEYLLSLITEGGLNVLTIHAEVEGMSRSGLFEDFLRRARARNLAFVPLGTLLPKNTASLPAGVMERGSIPGREGWVAVQGKG